MTPPSDEAAGTAPRPPVSPAIGADALAHYRTVRAATEALARPLSAEDQLAQSMPDASPTKWHLGHTSWFFETFLLTPHLDGYQAFDPAYGYLFNSYYEAVGPRQPRPQRGLLTRPPLSEVMAYRAHVDSHMGKLLQRGFGALADLLDLGLAHEQQHQELILMDVLHLFAQSPLRPAYAAPRATTVGADPGPAGYVEFAGGLVEIGHGGESFAFDNEGPRHKVYLEPYRLADRLVTNGEWLAFIEAGGYARPEFWLSEGWARVQAEGWRAPLYWEEAGGAWQVMTLHGLRPLHLHRPVVHVSFYEAHAFANWSGRRLPTEAEWEHAAERLAPNGAFLDLNGPSGLTPRPAPPAHGGLRQMFGDVWEWTGSAYAPYPGFRAAAGAIGEYNGKFMVGQMVLRGGACVTPAGHVRASYRNFFQPHQRWMFAGVRLAEDGAVKVAPVRRRRSTFATDIIEGLSKAQKQAPPKYFYDAEGSRLFEEITELAEYYPTRTELGILTGAAAELSAAIPAGAALVEFGSGASTKTRLILDAAPQIGVYVPIDISRDALDEAAAAIRRDYPGLTVAPLVEDFTTALELPAEAAGRPHVGFFPGSTIGNFNPQEARGFLAGARRLLGAGASFIVGADLVKDEATLVAAYDDAAGVTAAFNLNLLTRINRELDGTFDLSAFAHRAIWNPEESRMEMHLVSLRDQAVSVAGQAFHFREGETLHTENSYKFTIEGFAAMAAEAGWRLAQSWVSPAPAFAVMLLES